MPVISSHIDFIEKINTSDFLRIDVSYMDIKSVHFEHIIFDGQYSHILGPLCL